MRIILRPEPLPPNLLPREERDHLRQLAAHAGARAESPDALKKTHELSQAPSAALTLSLDEVAQLLGLDDRQLKRKARELRQRHGFPSRLPGSDWRFSRAAVEAWIEASGQGGESPREVRAGTDTTAALIELQRASLRGRYGGGR